MKKNKMSENNCLIAAKVFKTLSHPLRLKIMCAISQEEKSVGEIEKSCSASQSLISQCLKKLENENYIASRRAGQKIYYKVTDKRIITLFTTFEKMFCGGRP